MKVQCIGCCQVKVKGVAAGFGVCDKLPLPAGASRSITREHVCRHHSPAVPDVVAARKAWLKGVAHA